MGFTARRLLWPAAAIAGVAAILGILAVLQYRWTTQISDSDRERMRTQLRTAIGQFRQDFYRDMVTVSAAFQVDADSLAARDWSRFTPRYEEWARNPANTELVSGVYLWSPKSADGHQDLELDREVGAFVEGKFPDKVRKTLQMMPWRGPGGALRRVAWTFDAALPGLVRPIHRFRPGFRSQESRGAQDENAPGPDLVGVAVIALNEKFIVHQLFPVLVQRHLNLSGATYHVSVFATTDPAHPIFESGPTPAHTDEKPDAEIGLVESPFVPNRNQGARPRGAGPADPPAPPPDSLRQNQVPTLRRSAMTLPAAIIPGRTSWRIAAQHPAGSLRAAVDITRRTNLMMSFGALVILAGSIFLLFLAMHRTRALSRMQMEFVAGVSHELRTPVSVICSAADNLAEGVVEGKPQVQNYGQLIRGEARRLASMVEQILLFSAGKEMAARYNLQPVDITSVIEGVLRDAQTGVVSAGMTLERAIDADLPHVMGDGGAIARCLENLVSNAIKYGATGGWMRVSASTTTRRGRPDVAISVEDHGSGIAPSELRRIFEPFYRGTSALDSQIHGTGLGLSLARKLARAMRGEIQVESDLGKGTRFTLTLPAADMPTVTEQESVNEPVHTAD